MATWFSEGDIQIEKIITLSDIKGYVLPHAGTEYTKQVLNSTLQFKPKKKFKNVYIYYLPAKKEENININGKKYYHEYYVPWMVLKYVFTKYWDLNLKEIKFNQAKLINDIYKNIFLDKKKISYYPRYISLKKLGKPKIDEIKDFDFINDTLLQVLL